MSYVIYLVVCLIVLAFLVASYIKRNDTLNSEIPVNFSNMSTPSTK